MIKLIKKLTVASLLVLTLFSCSQGNLDGIDQSSGNIADLRNYNSNGEVYTGNSRSAARKPDVTPTFSAKLTNERWSFYRIDRTYIGGDQLPEWVKDTITVEDWENGIRVVYHRPEDQPNFAVSTMTMDWFGINYIDGNENTSTRTTADWIKMNGSKTSDRWDPAVKETFTLDFPLLNPGQKAVIEVHYGYSVDSEFALFYEIMPIHGKGCIKDLKKNFTDGTPLHPESVKHAILNDTEDGLILNIKNVEPPKGKNLRQAYNLFKQNGNSKYFDTDWKQIGYVSESVEDPAKKFTVNLSEFSEFKDPDDLKYLYCQFSYIYELEEFPDLTFETPVIVTEIIECDKFVTK